MTQQTNYAIGSRGEKRIVKKLEGLGITITENGPHNHIPDVRFRVGKNQYAAELKTLLLVHSGGRTGVVKLSRTEFNAMQSIPGDKCMIIETRPRARRSYAYLIIPWIHVEEFFQKNRPQLASLPLAWVLKNCVNLEYWVRIQEVLN